eukprot:gene9200-biopygen11482
MGCIWDRAQTPAWRPPGAGSLRISALVGDLSLPPPPHRNAQTSVRAAPRGGEGVLRALPRAVPHKVGAVARDGAHDPVFARSVDDDLEHSLQHLPRDDRRDPPQHRMEGTEVCRDDGDRPAQRAVLLRQRRHRNYVGEGDTLGAAGL